MNVTYQYTFAAVCPVDGSRDIYELTAESERTIPAEEIVSAVKRVTERSQFQESITRKLATMLGVRVQTVGTHSGVITTVVCDPAEAEIARAANSQPLPGEVKRG